VNVKIIMKICFWD